MSLDMAAEHAKTSGKDPSTVKVAMIYQDDPFSLDVRQGVVDQIKKYKMNTVIDDRMKMRPLLYSVFEEAI